MHFLEPRPTAPLPEPPFGQGMVGFLREASVHTSTWLCIQVGGFGSDLGNILISFLPHKSAASPTLCRSHLLSGASKQPDLSHNWCCQI